MNQSNGEGSSFQYHLVLLIYVHLVELINVLLRVLLFRYYQFVYLCLTGYQANVAGACWDHEKQ